jgi:thiol-disulfide isomerase/thioredoxin
MVTGVGLAFLAWAGVHYQRVRAARSQLYTPLTDSPPLDFPDVRTFSTDVTPAPEWVLQDLAGKEHRLSDFHGEVVFLDFWATWCSDCSVEMSYIESLRQKLTGAPVVFALVSAEDRSTVQKFVTTEHVTLPVYIALTKPPAALETYGLPTTYILNSEGRLVYRHVGAARWDSAASVKFLQAVAQSRAPSAGRRVSAE